MKFVVFSVLSLLVAAVSAFHIVPPASIATCDPLTVAYDTTTGLAPFSLSFHTDSEDGPIIAAFTDVTGISFTWDRVTIPAGTNVVIVLGDSSGVGSATPVITVSPGSSDVCLDSPTSIPPVPSVTSDSPFTSTFSGLSSLSSTTSTLSSSLSSSTGPFSSSVSSTTSTLSSSLSSTTSTLTSSLSSSTDPFSSSLSSLSSVISSASSLASNLTATTSTPALSATGALGDNDAAVSHVSGVLTIGAITAFVGVLLA